ncbi:hypothetical protein DH2020_043251 [Rehmannia glutinosa]|uniref:Uncharacterized protein n=1 Tax=Rehmannia glutinosa TaxID=99300 RepID=A0ABR0UK73_REHGL
MEDEKLAAYYDDLTRRGGGAARFKQGLGFSSNNDAVPSRGSALPSTSSFLSGFVRASSPAKTSEFEKQVQLQSVQNKLSKKPKEKTRSRSPSRNSSRRSRSRSPSRDKHSRRRSRSRSRSRDRYSRRRSRSRSRDRQSRRRNRSRENEAREKYRSRSRSRSREKNKERSKRRGSPAERRSEKGKKRGAVGGDGGIDYAKLIEGYGNMTAAERVKAKMKLQLSKLVKLDRQLVVEKCLVEYIHDFAEKDETIGKGSGWERFDFDKDAPLDDEEIEAAEDDAVLVKHMGQSFRFLRCRREEEIKAAHDEAMFGGASYPPPAETETDEEAQVESLGKKTLKAFLSQVFLVIRLSLCSKALGVIVPVNHEVLG